MKYLQLSIEEEGVRVQISCFTPPGGVSEWHAMLHVEPRHQGFQEQYLRLRRAEFQMLANPYLEGAQVVFRRFFLSDSTNQHPVLSETQCSPASTESQIQQPPLDGSKVALWIYMQRGMEVLHPADEAGSTVASHNGYRHVWTMGLTSPTGSSFEQTENMLVAYDQLLAHRHDTNLAQGCIRTWFFVRDVDTQYQGLVEARREYFTRIGLTEQTHYISSTGIGGNPAHPKALVQLGAYALTGFLPQQQTYLHASTHLNRTSEYGVTFERGTLLRFGDRRHLYISGTASIDHRGQVVHVGDVRQQTLRMWENVEKLLEEGGADMSHCAQIIVYLRDIADYSVVQEMFASRFPEVPTVITLAPVCRPAWLIEMECIAIREDNNKAFRPL